VVPKLAKRRVSIDLPGNKITLFVKAGDLILRNRTNSRGYDHSQPSGSALPPYLSGSHNVNGLPLSFYEDVVRKTKHRTSKRALKPSFVLEPSCQALMIEHRSLDNGKYLLACREESYLSVPYARRPGRAATCTSAKPHELRNKHVFSPLGLTRASILFCKIFAGRPRLQPQFLGISQILAPFTKL
jgi:hypothetical protein